MLGTPTGPGSPTGTFRSIYRPPFRIDLATRPGVPRTQPAGTLVAALGAALGAGGAPEPASVGLVLADDAELAALNAVHMGKAGPTDVLSFPLLPPEAYPPHEGGPPRDVAADRSVRGDDRERAFLLPPGTRLHLGDIVVSVERAIAQAAAGRGGQTGDVSWSAGDELRLLVVHGGLHLCGWDHAEPVEEAAMRALEREILAALAAAT